MTLPTVVGEFRAAADPELRFTPSGMAVCNLRVVASSRKKNDQTGEWEDDKTCWLSLTAFKEVAQNIAESIAKGDLVVVTGRLQTDNWEDREGNKRTSMSMVVDNIGPALRWATAKVSKADRREGGGGASSSASNDDPWQTSGTPPADEPPPF